MAVSCQTVNRDVPASMRAVIQRGYGATHVYACGEVPVPQAGDGEVQVRVRAAGLDRGTWHLMTGEPMAARVAFGLTSPRNTVPGLDLSGVVVGVGNRVSGFRIGDEVFGIGKGTFAPYTVASESKLAYRPANVSFEAAAAVPVSGLTALQAVDAARLSPGRSVLILGASGGVGSFAVQIAALTGARVTAVCRASKASQMHALGADSVEAYDLTDPLTGGETYHAIIAIGGSYPLSLLRRAMHRSGTLVLVGADDGGRWLGVGKQLRAVAVNPFVGQDLKMLISSENQKDLERLADLIRDGTLIPQVDRIFPLDQVAAAMTHLVEGRATGKVVLSTASPVKHALD